MDRLQLQNIFRNKYRTEDWVKVLMEVFGATEIRREPRELSSEHNDKVTGYEIGSLTRNGFEIGLYEFEIKSSYRIGLNRVGLRSLVKSYLSYGVDAAIVVYWHGDQWRVSFICDLQENRTNPKRFTYLMGDAAATYRTAVDRFIYIEENNATWQSIVDAFSVEKLSKAFFDGYKRQFKIFCDHIGGNEKWERDYVKKLLGRLVFLQFLQKKGWMGVPASRGEWKGGDPNFMANLIESYQGQDDILSNVLEPLFFDTLNTRRKDDLADARLGKDIRIPYLNGGLFDRGELDTEHRVEFPYTLFKGLMEFFSSYNFTIDENDPDDSEVGIDPEMLGHIFENLLEDNKDKGTFYTPKEIVQYMSRQSLIQYLHTHTEPSIHAAIDRLIQTGEVETALQNRNVAVRLDALLREVKVCDPAIGSGAFPMGVLGEIFKCRRVLYGFMNMPSAFSPSEVKRQIIQENIYGVDIEQGAVDIARLRFWLSLVVDEECPQPLPNLDFKIMQGNSLLESFEGVDLSKFTEHKDDDMFGSAFEAQTREAIEPLIKRHFSVTDHQEKERIRAEIDAIIKGHIEESLARRERELSAEIDMRLFKIKGIREFIDNPATPEGNRRKYRKNMKSEECLLAEAERRLAKVADSRVHIAQVDSTNCPFFLWHLYFKDVFDKGGFDIVIANPPYVQLQGNGGFLAQQFVHAGYETFTRMGDLYCLFYEKGIELLRNGGVETYITSSKWMRAAYGESLRTYLTDYNPLMLIELGPGVFDSATVDTNILLVEKGEGRETLQITTIRGKDDFKNLSFQTVAIPADGSAWLNKSPIEQSIDAKIRQYGIPLKYWDIKINFGVKTGYNEAFIIDSDKRAELIAADPKSEEIITPLLRGKDIQRYYSPISDRWLINSHNGVREVSLHPVNIEEYPAVKAHLESYVTELEQRQDKGKTPYNLRNCAYLPEFDKEKIVWKRIGSILRFCYDDTGSVVLDSTCFSSGPNSKYLTAVLNSKMGHYLLKDAPKTGTGDLLISVQALEPVAIPLLSASDRKPFEDLVDEIIRLKKENPDADTSVQEEQLNSKAFKLYNLTSDEIAIILNR